MATTEQMFSTLGAISITAIAAYMSVAQPARFVTGGGNTFAMSARASAGLAGIAAAEGGGGDGSSVNAQPAKAATTITRSNRGTAAGLTSEWARVIPRINQRSVSMPAR